MIKLLLFLWVASVCLAQVCIPETQPQPDSPYAYIRVEINALRWLRYALTESQKIVPPEALNEQERFHELVNMYAVAQTVLEDYKCAAAMLKSYKDSNNESVRESVDALLKGIGTIKDVDSGLVEMIGALYKAQKPEDIDLIGIAKMLANVQGIQKDFRYLTTIGVKMSTFGILRMHGDGDDARPVAFAITEKQRNALLREVQELAQPKDQDYVDDCLHIFLSTLNRKLPTSPQ